MAIDFDRFYDKMSEQMDRVDQEARLADLRLSESIKENNGDWRTLDKEAAGLHQRWLGLAEALKIARELNR